MANLHISSSSPEKMLLSLRNIGLKYKNKWETSLFPCKMKLENNETQSETRDQRYHKDIEFDMWYIFGQPGANGGIICMKG